MANINLNATENIAVHDELDIQKCFRSIGKQEKDYITTQQLWREISKAGLSDDDPRLKNILKDLGSNDSENGQATINFEEFKEISHKHSIVKNALSGNLVIPDFQSFVKDIKTIYNKTKSTKRGKVADYIPQLARINPELYAISVCTVDGQTFSIGDFKENFCLQSTCKPANYCIAHEDHGEEFVHRHIGREPSGKEFNELSLNKERLPHNPLINSGAIMCCSLIKSEQTAAERFEYVLSKWKELTGGIKPGFNNSVYLSEKQTADRNFALAYFMRENKAFPPNTDILKTLDFYFQCCSIELSTVPMAYAAATLANAGINPFTGQKVFNAKTVQNCLSLMFTCGMYDFSGEFAFKIGIPSKSGVSGALFVVIPNVAGICIYSPTLDEHGNSVKGIEFCKQLVKKYNFHVYDILSGYHKDKRNPQLKKYESEVSNVIALIIAARNGDLDEIHRLESVGTDLNEGDYDGRTALHLAAAEGRFEVVKYLINSKVNPSPKDRWGRTPLADAKFAGHKKVINFLEKSRVEK